MKTTRTLTVGDNRYEAYLTIKDMRMVEREINQSLLSIFDASSLAVISRMTANLGIDLVMAVLRFAIHDEKQGQRSDKGLTMSYTTLLMNIAPSKGRRWMI